MSERKVLNKYYPPDFDPTKIPKMKRERNQMYTIRIMAPFNMRCNTCGEYIYKGKKFNSRKETVEDETYLGLYIFRFYIRCPRCIAVIAFKTDPENTDYTLEAGATRNFEASRTAEELAKKEEKAREEEEANNPMKVLENRTKASANEMAMLETLEELKDLNKRHANVDFETMTEKYRIYEEQLKQLQDDEDEKFVQSLFGKGEDNIKRLQEDDDEDEGATRIKIPKLDKPTDILAQDSLAQKETQWSKGSSSTVPKKNVLQGIVKRKTASKPEVESIPASASDNNPNGHISVTKRNDDTSSNLDAGSCTNKTHAKTTESFTTAEGNLENKVQITNSNTEKIVKPAEPSGLSLLGNYSGSESNSSSSGSESD